MPNFNFKETAQAAIAASPVMTARAKLDPDEIRNRDLTMDEIGWYSADRKDDDGDPVLAADGTPVQDIRIVAHFVEFPDNYVNMGSLMKKIAIAWAAGFDGDIEAASDELKTQGGVKCRITLKKSASGNKFNNIEFI